MRTCCTRQLQEPILLLHGQAPQVSPLRPTYIRFYPPNPPVMAVQVWNYLPRSTHPQQSRTVPVGGSRHSHGFCGAWDGGVGPRKVGGFAAAPRH